MNEKWDTCISISKVEMTIKQTEKIQLEKPQSEPTKWPTKTRFRYECMNPNENWKKMRLYQWMCEWKMLVHWTSELHQYIYLFILDNRNVVIVCMHEWNWNDDKCKKKKNANRQIVNSRTDCNGVSSKVFRLYWRKWKSFP